ncbi:hypothetical protein [Oricola sp.]|uniref:hypothetical protein n=1 Tax=Oricola sp. TaxID=1979950 RepID=UPI003BAB66E6
MKHRQGLVAIRTPIAIAAAAFLLSGCLGPTYGTEKSTTEHLFSDLRNAANLRPKRPEPINYTPRPELVKPTNTASLPAPQESVAATSPDWPESPEQRLARIRAEADEGNIQPGLAATVQTDPDLRKRQDLGASPRDYGDTPIEAARRARADRERRAEKRVEQTAPKRRVYLTDPPDGFRDPAPTADYGDLGETESSKERARKRALAEPKSGWRALVPWL